MSKSLRKWKKRLKVRLKRLRDLRKRRKVARRRRRIAKKRLPVINQKIAEREKKNEPKPKADPVDARLVDLVAHFEGFVATPYNDVEGHSTIGYGHLLHYGAVTEADRKKWGTITKKEAKALLRADLVKYRNAVRAAVKVKLNRAQENALVSWCFNVGIGALQSSTLVRLLNQGDYDAVPAQLLRWDKGSDGKPISGLTRRRQAEARLWQTGEYPS